MFDLTGRVALVTGAGQHVGRAIAEALANRGAAVAVNDIVTARARDVADAIVKTGGRALAATGDVTDLESMKSLVLETETDLGPVDLLVSNAGNSGATRAVPTQFIDMDPGD